MYVESLVMPQKVITVAGAPVVAEALSTLGGHREATVPQNARLFMDVTAVSGTSPSMTMNVYGLVGGKLYYITNFAAVTGVGQYTVLINNLPDLICFAPSPVSGTTPSFTCEIRCVR